MRALAPATRAGGEGGGARRRRRGGDRARHHRVERDSGRRDCARWTITTCGATIAPKARRRRSPRPAHRGKPGGARMVRRRVLLRMGILEAAALAARTIPTSAREFASALEHCDMVAAMLCGITDPRAAQRSVCAMGHKWMWNRELGGLPPEEFPGQGGPAAGGRARQAGWRLRRRPTRSPGTFAPEWAEKLGLRAGIPIPVGAFDAHWDAIGAGVREGDVVNVVGTSTCIMAMRQAGRSDPRRVRRGEGQRPSAVLRHRGGLVGDRRYFRGHRAPRGHHGGGASARTGALSRRPDRPAAADLGQRRPHRAGERGIWAA